MGDPRPSRRSSPNRPGGPFLNRQADHGGGDPPPKGAGDLGCYVVSPLGAAPTMTLPHRSAQRPEDPSSWKGRTPAPGTQDRAPSQQTGPVLPQAAPTTPPPLGQPRGPSPGRIGPRRPAPPAPAGLRLRFRLPPRFTRTGSREPVPPPPSRRPSQQSLRRLKGEASTSAASEGAKHALLFPQAALKERASRARSRLGGGLGRGHPVWRAGRGLPRGTWFQLPPPTTPRPWIHRL